jgi:hypothetical protein
VTCNRQLNYDFQVGGPSPLESSSHASSDMFGRHSWTTALH